jgi:hypothetical protein
VSRYEISRLAVGKHCSGRFELTLRDLHREISNSDQVRDPSAPRRATSQKGSTIQRRGIRLVSQVAGSLAETHNSRDGYDRGYFTVTETAGLQRPPSAIKGTQD